MNTEELERRISENTEHIKENLDKIEKNLEKINTNSKNIERNSIAFEILRDYSMFESSTIFSFLCCI